MRKIFFCLLLTALFSVSSLADIPRPTPAPKPAEAKGVPGQISIDLRSDAKVPTLKIRRELLDSLRASLDQNAENTTAAAIGFGTGRGNTIIAGALLSVALVFAGFIAFRGGRRFAKVAAPLAIIAAVGFGALTLYANTPPPRFFKVTTRIFDPSVKNYGGHINDSLVIQVVDEKPGVYTGMDEREVILEVPKADDKTTE
ncbi:MAG: hypothetical protein JO053_00160 [Acidobacteria bacterium]|nr:hypothetical protein [Acidobacteriota bacterium]